MVLSSSVFVLSVGCNGNLLVYHKNPSFGTENGGGGRGAMFLFSVPTPENGRAHVDPCQPLSVGISSLVEDMEHVVPVSKADMEEGW